MPDKEIRKWMNAVDTPQETPKKTLSDEELRRLHDAFEYEVINTEGYPDENFYVDGYNYYGRKQPPEPVLDDYDSIDDVAVGDEVKVSYGPFWDFDATVKSILPNGDVMIDFKIFGRTHTETYPFLNPENNKPIIIKKNPTISRVGTNYDGPDYDPERDFMKGRGPTEEQIAQLVQANKEAQLKRNTIDLPPDDYESDRKSSPQKRLSSQKRLR
jgi:hypothetical protein